MKQDKKHPVADCGFCESGESGFKFCSGKCEHPTPDSTKEVAAAVKIRCPFETHVINYCGLSQHVHEDQPIAMDFGTLVDLCSSVNNTSPKITDTEIIQRAREISKDVLYSPVTNGKANSSIEHGATLILTFAANQTSQTNELLKEAGEALHELIQVKDWKDEYGKDEQYQKAMPIAWQNAREVLSKINIFNLRK